MALNKKWVRVFKIFVTTMISDIINRLYLNWFGHKIIYKKSGTLIASGRFRKLCFTKQSTEI